MKKKNTSPKPQIPQIKKALVVDPTLNTNNKTRIEKYAWHIIFVLIVVGLIPRLYRLDYQTLWVDEYVHAGVAKKFLTEGGSMLGWELNQMFINILNCIFTLLFGFSDFVLRFPVAFFSIIGVPAIYILGKKMFNNSVGLIAAVLFTSSQFLTAWARIDRAYGLIPAFYVLVLFAFWMMQKNDDTEKKQFKLFHFLEWNQKYFLFLIGIFFLAFITQIQVFLFVFTVSFYYFFLFVNQLFNPQCTNKFRNQNALIAYINIAFIVLLFTPLTEVIMRPFIGAFLPTKMVDLILPNWNNIRVVMKTLDWSKNFLTYWNVIVIDFHYLYIIGWLGFVAAFWQSKKGAFFLIAAFVVPIILMGFILREPNWAKYMSFYYPVFFIAIAVFLHTTYKIIIPKIMPRVIHLHQKKYRVIAVIALLVIFKISLPLDEIYTLCTTEDHLSLVDLRLCEAGFPPWKKEIAYVLDHKKEGDVVMATLVDPCVHYTDVKDVIHFRQNVLNGKTRKWEQMPLTPEMIRKDNAYSFEELVKTFHKHERGWLLADYYLNNISTNERCRQFVFDSMDYHYNQNEDGYIKIFSWDHRNPKKIQTPLNVELGKLYNDVRPIDPLEYNLDASMLQKMTNVFLRITYEGIDHAREASFVLNDKFKFFVAVPDNTIKVNGIQILRKSKGIQVADVNIPLSYLKAGVNKVLFSKEANTNGYVIYDCQLSYKK